MPASLEEERDGLKKDLKMLKTKLGDTEGKFKSTLIEKSKVEVGDVHYLVHAVRDVGNAHPMTQLWRPLNHRTIMQSSRVTWLKP